jgi:thioredoxin-like negative regulator of GroEL
MSTAERQPPRRRISWETILWTAVIAFVVWVQWPMLKGLYYRATGGQALVTIAWRTDLDAALAESRATGRRVLVDFNAEWCPPCVVMKHDVWPHRRVTTLVEQDYVPVLIDIDRDAATSSRYGIDAIPAVLILDGTGAVLARAGYLPVSGMERLLKEHAAPRQH